MSTPSILRTVAQVAEQLAVTPKTVRNLLKRKELKRVKIGRAVRISQTDVDRFLGRNTER